MEQALRRAEARYRALFEAAPVGIAILGADGRIQELNTALPHVTGWSEARLRRQDLWGAFEGGQEVRDRLRRGDPVQGEELRLASGDRTVVCDARRIPVEEETLFLVLVRDVTDAVRLARDLRESQRALSTLLSNLPGMAYRCRLDPERTMELVSEGSTELTGYRPEELVQGRVVPFGALIHPEDRERVWVTVRAAAEADHSFMVRYRITTASGDERHVWEQGRPVRTPRGEVRVEGFVMDVTPLVRAEQARESIQAQLLRSQKLEAVGTLAGGVAHDFNNLLTAIQGHAELALEQVHRGGSPERGLERVLSAAGRAARVTRQLLVFSRKQPVQARPVDLNVVVHNVRGMLDRVIGEDVVVETALEEGLLLVRGDEGSLEQVLINLALNARDAMPEGGILRVVTENVEVVLPTEPIPAGGRSGPAVRLTVSDTGAGMPPDVLEHLFEPFFTTKEPGKGSGLGLAVVYGIIRDHRGWVEVQSELGQGTTFHVYFPAEATSAAEPEAQVRPRVATAGRGERVLLVEDDDDVRDLVQEVLARNGYRVTAVAGRREAEEVFQQRGHEVDLLLSDVVLADGNGVALAQAFREQRPDLKVLMSSGYADRRGRTEDIRRLGLPFLRKPYAVDELLTAVRDALAAPER